MRASLSDSKQTLKFKACTLSLKKQSIHEYCANCSSRFPDMDNTRYKSIEKTPELQLRQIFARAQIPVEMRIMLGDEGFLDVDQFAALGDDLASFKTSICAALGEKYGIPILGEKKE